MSGERESVEPSPKRRSWVGDRRIPSYKSGEEKSQLCG